MRLVTFCSSCRMDYQLPFSAPTRGQLQMQMGDELDVNCNHCGKLEKKHINEIRASINNKVILVGLLASAIMTIFLWLSYGAIGTVTMIIPIFFWQQEMAATRSFNNYVIRRK